MKEQTPGMLPNCSAKQIGDKCCKIVDDLQAKAREAHPDWSDRDVLLFSAYGLLGSLGVPSHAWAASLEGVPEPVEGDQDYIKP
jgi:hypothetical protein